MTEEDLFLGLQSAIMEAMEVSKGNFPVGTRMTFTLDEPMDISGVTLPPGRYEVSRLEDEPICARS